MDYKTLIEAFFLGILEGLTEFIPVSSTGHLILFIDLLEFQSPPGKVFEIIIQLGAIFAICWVYRQKILTVTLTLHKDKNSQRFASNILLAFLPAAVIGVFLHDFIKEVLFSPIVVSWMLIIGGIAILWIESRPHSWKTTSLDDLPLRRALAIGFCQTLAMIPGVSRSGATIMGAMLLGVERKVATEFSFFLAIPTMFGATVYDIYKNYNQLNADNTLIIAVGFVSAFIAALLVVRTVVAFVSTHGFKPFAWYRIVIGSIMLLLSYNIL